MIPSTALDFKLYCKFLESLGLLPRIYQNKWEMKKKYYLKLLVELRCFIHLKSITQIFVENKYLLQKPLDVSDFSQLKT